MKLSGVVVKGQGFASLAFGLPTANLEFNRSTPIEPGTYVGQVWTGVKQYPAIMYAGPAATEKFEVHLFGFTGDLYGQTLSFEIQDRISESVPWQGERHMHDKVLADVAKAKAYFGLGA
jgi:riboflavin kinase / FMN adenylyltransferase